MIAVQRSLGRLVVVAVSQPVSKLDVMRMQQDLSASLRRMGERAILVCDLRDLGCLDPDVASMLSLMLSSASSLARRRVVLGVSAGTFGADFVEAHPTWLAVGDVAELQAVLGGVGTPAEQHAAHEILVRREAA
jgi:hypothetical protein